MRRFFPILLLLSLTLIAGCASGNSQAQGTSSKESVQYIENKGSDTIVNLALAWAEQYQQQFPQVRISVTGGGSGTGLTALINGTVDIVTRT